MYKFVAFFFTALFALPAASQGTKLPFEWLQEDGKNVGCAVEQGGTTRESRDLAECEEALRLLKAHYAPKRLAQQEGDAAAPSQELTVLDSVKIITGAIVGGVIGHQFGKGSGKKAATVAGAVLGGALVYQGVRSESDEYVDRRYAPSYQERQYRDGYQDGYRRAVVVRRSSYGYRHGSGNFYGDDPCGGRLSYANCARWQDDIKKHELHRDLVQEQNYRETERGW